MQSSQMAVENQHRNLDGSLSVSRATDLLLFGILFGFLLLFQLQVAAPWISKLMIRELLYGIIYLRIIFFYRMRFSYNLWFIFIFFIYAFFVGIHTFLLFGQNLALSGLMRFINVALLAPPAAVLFTNLRQVRLFIDIWLGVYLVGAGTLFYQVAGGDMSWLFEGYISVRGSLARFMTILGEPNIGGMAAVLVAVLALLGTRSFFRRWFLLVVSVAFLVFSISKAALLGLLITGLIIFLYRYKRIVLSRKVVLISLAAIVFILCVAVMALNTDLAEIFSGYSTSLTGSFLGQQENTLNASPSFWKEIWYRVIEKVHEGIEVSTIHGDIYFLNFLFGSSYGIAGSVAVNERGFDLAILPHNGYLEMFLVGGVSLLLIFLWILLVSFVRLRAMSVNNHFCHALFVCFLILILFNVGYPVFNQPILGAFLWLLIGIASNGSVWDDVKEDC